MRTWIVLALILIDSLAFGGTNKKSTIYCEAHSGSGYLYNMSAMQLPRIGHAQSDQHPVDSLKPNIGQPVKLERTDVLTSILTKDGQLIDERVQSVEDGCSMSKCYYKAIIDPESKLKKLCDQALADNPNLKSEKLAFYLSGFSVINKADKQSQKCEQKPDQPLTCKRVYKVLEERAKKVASHERAKDSKEPETPPFPKPLLNDQIWHNRTKDGVKDEKEKTPKAAEGRIE